MVTKSRIRQPLSKNALRSLATNKAAVYSTMKMATIIHWPVSNHASARALTATPIGASVNAASVNARNPKNDSLKKRVRNRNIRLTGDAGRLGFDMSKIQENIFIHRARKITLEQRPERVHRHHGIRTFNRKLEPAAASGGQA